MTTKFPTMQSIFDFVVKHLRNQGLQARNGEWCAYLDHDTGKTCAVGCLISKEEYNEFIETAAVEDDRVLKVLQKSIGRNLKPVEIEMLKDLQNAHDFYVPKEKSDKNRWSEVEYKFDRIQSEYELKPVV